MSVVIRDHKDRVIISIDKGKVAVARFQDLSEEFKAYAVEVYSQLTDEDPVKLQQFLDYKEEEDEFCV